MSNKKIDFSEFNKTDFETWKAKAIKDLKGKDYSILTLQTDEEIAIHTLIESKTYKLPDPGNKSFIRGNYSDNNEWTVFQSFTNPSITELNAEIRRELNNGISGINLDIEKYVEIEQLFKGINLEHILSSFSVCSSKEAIDLVASLPKNTCGWLNFNPMSKDFIVGIDEVMNLTKNRPTLKAFNIDGASIRNQGGNITDEIAYLLSCGNEYLNHFKYTGTDINLVAEHILFTTGIGSNYFFEIAKIRAIRRLWATIVDQYHPTTENASHIHIHSKTSSLNLFEKEPYNNLLRQTTEAMSAAIGGCDSIEVVPYKSNDPEENVLFARMAKNIQLILKEEALFNQVKDPAGGSYYIESLTDELCEKAWKKFQEMEAQGGFLDAYEAFNKKLALSKKAYEEKIASGEKIKVGVNKYLTEKV